MEQKVIPITFALEEHLFIKCLYSSHSLLLQQGDHHMQHLGDCRPREGGRQRHEDERSQVSAQLNISYCMRNPAKPAQGSDILFEDLIISMDTRCWKILSQ